jgi:glutamyl-Q tRNA(Asp) synthetase
LEIVTRFAPGPTGLLHLGHAHSALTGWHRARDAGGRFLVRIEDIDPGRCRPAYEAAILEDLAWLGLDWDGPVRRQSEHLADYAAALARLEADGLLYPCFCTRSAILAEIAAMGGAPHGADGPLYPGTCRRLDPAERAARIAAGEPYALRIDGAAAAARTGPLRWRDEIAGLQDARPDLVGDAVLGRKDSPASYHLAVTVDDAIQGVTRVTRGADLFQATHLHRLLQALLGLPVPVWHHHALLCDEDGRRLAKRSDARTIARYRQDGATPAAVRALAGFPD